MLRQHSLISLLLVIVATVMSGRVVAQSQIEGLPEGYTTLPGYPFVVIAESDTINDFQISDSLFNVLAVGVQFKVNRTEINPESDFFPFYKNDLLPVLLGNHLQLHKLFIRGAASPEGPYENNRRLGIGRCNALMQLIGNDLQNAYGQQGKLRTDSQCITEDYGYLIDLMRDEHDPDYQLVRVLFEQVNHDEKAMKARLQKVLGGKLWDRLYQQYYKRLRTARIVLLVSRHSLDLPDANVVAPHQRIEPPATLIAGSLHLDCPTCPVPDSSLTFTMPEFEYTRRHLIALRTNLLRDGFYMPQFGWAPGIDAQLEYYPLHGHYTYNAAFTWTNHRHWQSQEFFQVRDAQLELRRYFRGGGEFLGAYLGAYLEGSVYGIGLSKTKGWEGEGGGAGLTVGYVMPLNRRGNWRLEFMAAVGEFITRHDPYVYGNPITHIEDGDYYYNYLGSATAFKKRNHQFNWFGPTNLGIQITYDIIYRKRQAVQKGDAR